MITLAIFYYLYLAIILFFAIYSLFNIYHLIRFGFASLFNVSIILIYIVIATSLISYSFNLLTPIDWNLPLIDLKLNLLNPKISDINF